MSLEDDNRIGSQEDVQPIEVESLNLKRIFGGAVRVLPTSILIVFAFYGAKECGDEIRSRDDPGAAPVKREDGIKGLESYYNLARDGLSVEDKDFLISEHQLARQSFVSFSNYELKTDYTNETRRFVETERWSLIVDAANLLNLVSDENIVTINEEENFVEISGLRFAYGDTYREFLVDGILYQWINTFNSSLDESQRFEAHKRKDDLLWLAGQDLPVEARRDSYPLPPENVLINLARFYRSIQNLDYPIPEKIEFIIRPSGDIFWGGVYSPIRDKVYITNNSGDGTIVHELAHHQSDENEKFNQHRFNLIVRQALERYNRILTDEKLYVNPGVIDEQSPEGTSREDYAETIRTYFEDGVRFRQVLKTLFLEDHAAYEVMKAKYEFTKEFFGGKEFLSNGGGFLPKEGDIFVIDDPDKYVRGLCLRPEPSYSVKEAPLVFNGQQVKILEGPVIVEGPSEDQRELYRVMYISVRAGSMQVYSNLEGWVWSLWLGARLMPAEVTNTIPKINFLDRFPNEPCP